MKLIDLMVTNGVKWVSCASGAAQDYDGRLLFFSGDRKPVFHNYGRWHDAKWVPNSTHHLCTTADDHSTSIITKDQYESALNKNPLTREELIERVKKDGWPVNPNYVSEYRGWDFTYEGMLDPRFKRIDQSSGYGIDYVYWGDIYDENRIPLPNGYQNVCSDIKDRMAGLLSGRGSKTETQNHTHYFKDVSNIDTIDVYRVLDLFDVNQPAIQHAVKKLLCGGKRGTKNTIEDYQEAIDSIKRAIEMTREDNNASA